MARTFALKLESSAPVADERVAQMLGSDLGSDVSIWSTAVGMHNDIARRPRTKHPGQLAENQCADVALRYHVKKTIFLNKISI